MQSWNFFTNIYSTLITPIVAQMQSMMSTVCSTMLPVATALIGVWLLLAMFELSQGSKTYQQVFREAFVAMMALSMLQVGQYTQYVSNLVLQGVPNTLAAALGGQTSPVAGLDNVLSSVLTASAKIYEALPSYSLKTIPLAIAIIVFMASSAVSICFAFGVYMVASIINIVAIVIGPVFLALAAIPQTRRFAAGWLGVLVGGCTTQVTSIALIQALTGGEAILLQQIVVTAQGTNSNSIAMLWGLAQVALLLFLCALVVKEIPNIAKTIGAGVYHGAAGISSVTFGAAAAATGAAIGGARGAAAAVSGATDKKTSSGRNRSTSPAGRSLSGTSS
jgi:type IV secretion system protein VirB6